MSLSDRSFYSITTNSFTVFVSCSIVFLSYSISFTSSFSFLSMFTIFSSYFSFNLIGASNLLTILYAAIFGFYLKSISYSMSLWLIASLIFSISVIAIFTKSAWSHYLIISFLDYDSTYIWYVACSFLVNSDYLYFKKNSTSSKSLIKSYLVSWLYKSVSSSLYTFLFSLTESFYTISQA